MGAVAGPGMVRGRSAGGPRMVRPGAEEGRARGGDETVLVAGGQREGGGRTVADGSGQLRT